MKASRLKLITLGVLITSSVTLLGQSSTDPDMQALLERQDAQIKIVTFGALVPVALLFAFTFFFYYRRKRESDFRQRELELKYARTEMEMRALRAQVNPHFIFNCLSSIQHFIHHNNNVQAERYLVKFSRLIRQVLENSTHEFISLSDDLSLLQLYIDLEAIRLEGGFDTEVNLARDIDPENMFVPPMLLQPVVENAIWHGLGNRIGFPRKLIIAFEMEGEYLIAKVADNGNQRTFVQASEHERQSFGLSLIRERVALIGQMDPQTAVNMKEIIDEEGNYQGMKVRLIIPTE